MAVRRPFWKWCRWKSIGFCLWPPSTCLWNLKLKFQSKLDLCSGNHVVYRQTDGQTGGQTDRQGESSIPPSNFVGRGYKKHEMKNMKWSYIGGKGLLIGTSCLRNYGVANVNVLWMVWHNGRHSIIWMSNGLTQILVTRVRGVNSLWPMTPYGGRYLGQHWFR